MKKALFNKQYGLQSAVLEGRKKQTRRICKNQVNPSIEEAKWKVGEEVAVAQSYYDAGVRTENVTLNGVTETFYLGDWMPGWNNAMFVKAELMPHRIKITNIRIERLQDISREDCLKEGFDHVNINENCGNMLSHWEYRLTYEDKLGRSLQHGSRCHKEAFESLIDKISGKGTWDSNPWVFVYDFELVK